MGAPKARTLIEEALITDAVLRLMIFMAATKRARNKAQAEDFSQQAQLLAIINARKTGNPPPPPERKKFLDFVGSYLNTLRFNRDRAERRHPTANLDLDDPKGAHARTAAAPDADVLRERQQEDDRIGRMLDDLRGHLAEDEDPKLVLAMLDLSAKGLFSNAEMAEELQRKEEDVQRARRRIAYQAAEAKSRVEQAERWT
jgi:hypothetical protein